MNLRTFLKSISALLPSSRDCFPIALSTQRRENIVAACKAKGTEIYQCPVTVENEADMEKAVADVQAAGCNALTVLPGQLRPRDPETLIAKYFDGPVMYVAAAEGDGDRSTAAATPTAAC